MSKKHKRANSLGAYTAVPWAIMKTPAWRAMSAEARLVWIELRGWLKKDWSNNGRMFRSCRDAADAIGINRNTVQQKYFELEHYGFLRRTREGFLGVDAYGLAAEFRFTDLLHGTHPATRDYEKWTGELFTYKPRRPARKKQKPVLSHRTPRPVPQDTGRSRKRPSVCPVPQDTVSPSNCPVRQDTISLPPPEQGREPLQGSLTARAPAQAGGAGSSPAPVAKRVRVPKRGTEPHRDWADARRHDLSASLRRVRRRRHQAGDAGAAQPMCWATPRLVEVTDSVEAAAIQAYWRPQVAVSA